MAAFAPPLGTEVLLMVRTAASLVEIDGGRGHLRSASHPHEHRRFCNSGAHMASRGIPNRWLGIPGDQESASSTCQPGFRRFSRESNAPDSSQRIFKNWPSGLHTATFAMAAANGAARRAKRTARHWAWTIGYGRQRRSTGISSETSRSWKTIYDVTPQARRDLSTRLLWL